MAQLEIVLVDDGSNPSPFDENGNFSPPPIPTFEGDPGDIGSPASSNISPGAESQVPIQAESVTGPPADANTGQVMRDIFEQAAGGTKFGDTASKVFDTVSNVGQSVEGLLSGGGGAGSAVGGAAESVAAGGAAGSVGVGGGAAGGAAGGAVAALASNPYTIAVAAVAAVAVGGAAIVSEYDRIMGAEVDRLKGYSPEVGQAAAMSDLRSELADIRRAERIGPDLARYETFRSRAQDRLADLQTEILSVMLRFFEAVEPLLEQGLHAADILVAQTQIMTAAMDANQRLLSGNIEGYMKAMERVGVAVVKFNKETMEFLKQENGDKKVDDPWLTSFDKQQPIDPNDI